MLSIKEIYIYIYIVGFKFNIKCWQPLTGFNQLCDWLDAIYKL